MKHFTLFLREQFFIPLFLLTIFCAFLYGVRDYFSPRDFYLFLNWNLFLAGIPYGFSTLVVFLRKHKVRWIFLLPLLGGWFFFFPNAPYIVTDFLHLKHRPPVFFWFDIALLTSFAFTGLFFGFISLAQFHQAIEEKKGKILGWLFASSMWGLSSLGIYLGRFLRWNSWDFLTHPFRIIQDTWMRISHPNDYPGMFIFCFVYSALLLVFYKMFWELFSKGRK